MKHFLRKRIMALFLGGCLLLSLPAPALGAVQPQEPPGDTTALEEPSGEDSDFVLETPSEGAEETETPILPETSQEETGQPEETTQPDGDKDTETEPSTELLDDIAPFALDFEEVDANTVIVRTFDAFAEALGPLHTYTNIIFGDNITETYPVAINENKASLVIDGDGYSYTQRNNADETGSIYIRNANTKSVTWRNMTYNGYNYFGITQINSDYPDVTVRLENVTYRGPQVMHNYQGNLEIADSRITLAAQGQSVNELCEARTLTFEGECSVTVDGTTTNSLFWLTGTGGYCNVAEEADVTITTPHYLFYTTAGDGNRPTMTVASNASFVCTAANGFVEQSIASLTIEDNANFEFYQTGTTGSRAMRLNYGLSVGSGATFLYSRANTNSAAIQFTLASTMAFTDPALVAVYAANATPISTAYALLYTSTSDTFNFWASASSINDTGAYPTYRWNKLGTEKLDISALFNSGGVQTASSNLISGTDPVDNLINTTTFRFGAKSLMTLGRLPLIINTVTDNSLTVQGATLGGAELSGTFVSGGNDEPISGNAAGNGTFSIPLGANADLGSTLTLDSHANSLWVRQTTLVQDGTEYTLRLETVPDDLLFETVEIPGVSRYIPRDITDWTIVVQDNRVAPNGFSLQASSAAPLTGEENGTTYALNDGALVFVDGEGNTTPITSTPVLVYSADDTTGGTYNVNWVATQGPLLYVEPGNVRSDVTYTTIVRWDLVDAA